MQTLVVSKDKAIFTGNPAHSLEHLKKKKTFQKITSN